MIIRTFALKVCKSFVTDWWRKKNIFWLNFRRKVKVKILTENDDDVYRSYWMIRFMIVIFYNIWYSDNLFEMINNNNSSKTGHAMTEIIKCPDEAFVYENLAALIKLKVILSE